MFNFEKLSERISASGYRRKATSRKEYDEETGLFRTIYDFEHRRKLDLVSVVMDENGLLDYIEITNVDFDKETRKYKQSVHRLTDTSQLQKYI